MIQLIPQLHILLACKPVDFRNLSLVTAQNSNALSYLTSVVY
jgi:hypothetical protein